MSKMFRKYQSLPVYQKAQELLELAKTMADSLKEDEMKESLAAQIWTGAAIVQAKIAGAEGTGLFSLRMQNAVLIKVAIHDMLNAASFASMVEINEEDYVQLMRDKIEEFRVEFVEWLRSFDKKYDIPDNWGIRYDVSTAESERLEKLMFDEDYIDDYRDEHWGFDDEDEGKDGDKNES